MIWYLTVCKQKTILIQNWIVWNGTVCMYKYGLALIIYNGWCAIKLNETKTTKGSKWLCVRLWERTTERERERERDGRLLWLTSRWNIHIQSTFSCFFNGSFDAKPVFFCLRSHLASLRAAVSTRWLPSEWLTVWLFWGWKSSALYIFCTLSHSLQLISRDSFPLSLCLP